MKGLLTSPNHFENSWLNICWALDTNKGVASLTDNKGFKKTKILTLMVKGSLVFLIPLSHILGFYEDHRKIIYGVKHTLILTRCGNEDVFKTLNSI